METERALRQKKNAVTAIEVSETEGEGWAEVQCVSVYMCACDRLSARQVGEVCNLKRCFEMTHFVTDRKLDWLCAETCARLSKHKNTKRCHDDEAQTTLQLRTVEECQQSCRTDDTGSSLLCIGGVVSVNVTKLIV